MNFHWKAISLLLLLLITDFSLSHAGKLDKKNDKHKSNPPAKNSTLSRGNFSAPATPTPSHVQQTQLPIGWSLDKDKAQQHHDNPNGYALHHHEQQHGAHPQHTAYPMGGQQQQMGGQQQQMGGQQQQMGGQQQQMGGHQPIQQHQGHPPVQEQQQQNSGSGIGTAVAAGVGGLALGAGGGYLLNNMMNSGGGEKVEATTETASTTAEKATEAPSTAEIKPTEAPSIVAAEQTQAPVVIAEESPKAVEVTEKVNEEPPKATETPSETSKVEPVVPIVHKENSDDLEKTSVAPSGDLVTDSETSTVATEISTVGKVDSTEAPKVEPPPADPIVAVAGLAPGIQAAKIPNESEKAADVTTTIAPSGKSDASIMQKSWRFALLIIALQLVCGM